MSKPKTASKHSQKLSIPRQHTFGMSSEGNAMHAFNYHYWYGLSIAEFSNENMTSVCLPEIRPVILYNRRVTVQVNSCSHVLIAYILLFDMAHSCTLQTGGICVVVVTLLVQYVVSNFYTVINILDPHSLIWQRKNSSPYLTVAILTGHSYYVGRNCSP